MRRTDREIFGEELETILQKGEYGILSMEGPDGLLYAVPLKKKKKNGAIHLHCAAHTGKKLECLAHCKDVCFVVVGDTAVQPAKFTTLYESVIITGKIHPAEDKEESLRALIEKYSGEYMEAGMNYIRAAADQTGVYVITPRHMTGKANRGTKHSKDV